MTETLERRFLSNIAAAATASATHPSVEKDLSLKIDERDQTIWKSTLEF